VRELCSRFSSIRDIAISAIFHHPLCCTASEKFSSSEPQSGSQKKRRQAAALQKKTGALMPITITLLPSNEDGSGSNLFYAIGSLTFSGNYPTGGDTMDFTTVADKLPSTQIIQVFADSQNGNAGYYVPVQGSALNNWKLKAFTGGGTEVSAGAYPASVTTDIVQVTITARKLL
jgi:hypothetical protein